MARIPGVSKRTVILGVTLLSLVLCYFNRDRPVAEGGDANDALCPLSDVVETDGQRRLAFIVGVGQYKHHRIPDLQGPPHDARRFYDLLTRPHGYGFPKANVCLLLDEAATTERFRQLFERVLTARARPQDVAVFYYAGHGSRTRDENGDEPDEWDETFMLHDARVGDVRDLLDDEFHQMLSRLYEKTKRITVVLDSCNSGTATRGDNGTYAARFFQPAAASGTGAVQTDAQGDGESGWVPNALPGLIVFTAASDGTPALETEGRGIFTDAILRVFSQVADHPLTYAQAARQIAPLVAARSYQIPYFQGDLARPVFANTSRPRPFAWEVIAVGPSLKLSGPPLPGIGKGAELRIYHGAVTGADTRDPGKAKATVVVDEMTGVNATAHIAAVSPSAAAIAEGDLAVLVRPADAALRIKVRVRPEGEPGGLPAARAAELWRAIKAHAEARMLVDLTADAGDFELSLASDDHIQLRGPENRVRNTYRQEMSIPESLWQHARQRAFLFLQGEGGTDFSDNQTLQVQLIPAAKQSPCADGVWESVKPNTQQIIPLCHAWHIQVTLAKDAPMPLLIGGVILSTDGSLLGFPADGRTVRLKPGERVTFQGRQETFVGAPPLDVQDHVIVFGTQETNPIPWHLLSDTAAARAVDPPQRGLYRALDRYLQPGARAVTRQEETVEDTTWTLSTVTLRVEANSRFRAATTAASPITPREYTLQNFDIRPYLPDDPSAALFKVLNQADWLAQAAVEDGFGYKQHAWSQATDRDNLRLGIDCSRSIWFAFTRAGLPYNRSDRYVSTAMMVGNESLMADEFAPCTGGLQLGDVLVYRDKNRGDGHVVMVIDPDKRIAWGSHGWDGNAKALKIEPDTGVEYQLIKYKQDWQRWDRSAMRRRACWRYRTFSQEAKTPRGQPGGRALTGVCDLRHQCGRQPG